MSGDQWGGNEPRPWVEQRPPAAQLPPTAEKPVEVPETEQIRWVQPPPPQPLTPPPAAPMIAPMPVSAPWAAPGPADRRRAAVVALLNLNGLGLGYALMRRWPAAALCWVATGILLVIALPADPNGVPGALLVIYLTVLVLAAVHGALRARHTPLYWWPDRPRVATTLAVVLLAVPVGGGLLYNQAQSNAVQQMLLGRLSTADQLVAGVNGEPFASAQPQYETAMATYRDLLDNNRGSRAGQLVPDHLATFYQTVTAPYAKEDYCDAIAPLTYLRSLPGTFPAGALGSLATWPDDRLATSLYQCGMATFVSGTAAATTDINELLTTFPDSAQAGKVAPAVAALINSTAAGIGGSDPCKVTGTLHTLSTQTSALSGGTADVADALHTDASTATADVESGTYACGVSQYKGGDFTDAETTMDDYAGTYPQASNKALAQDFSIAAQIAEQEPAAGRVIPTLASGGSVQVMIFNDSPDPMEILYTGHVTGTVHIAACGKCSTYASSSTAQADACTDSSIDYPHATISLQAGTTYFLQQNTNDSGSSPNASSEQYDAGNVYEACAYETSVLGSLL